MTGLLLDDDTVSIELIKRKYEMMLARHMEHIIPVEQRDVARAWLRRASAFCKDREHYTLAADMTVFSNML